MQASILTPSTETERCAEELSLLAVLAHPDDESFGIGGTLALYSQRGVSTHLVCATRGEVGGVDDKHMNGYQTVSEVRESELRCAASILGLCGVYFLDYRDSGMPGSPDNQHPKALAVAPVEEVAERIAQTIRQLHPQVVVTFDPIGGYKHPDHIAIHRATTRAFHLAGDPGYVSDLPPYQPQRLYYSVFPKRFMRLALRLMPLFRMDPHRIGRNADIDLVSIVEEGNFPVHARIDIHSVSEQKEAASACHSSQLDGGPIRRGPLGWLLRWMWQDEQFMRAYPPPEARLRERDLFVGINDQYKSG